MAAEANQAAQRITQLINVLMRGDLLENRQVMDMEEVINAFFPVDRESFKPEWMPELPGKLHQLAILNAAIMLHARTSSMLENAIGSSDGIGWCCELVAVANVSYAQKFMECNLKVLREAMEASIATDQALRDEEELKELIEAQEGGRK
ncbi:MAG: hypothetical protein QM754_10765 [Tepidisphaeraceae bacterium]